jgi:hypothetical protein
MLCNFLLSLQDMQTFGWRSAAFANKESRHG